MVNKNVCFDSGKAGELVSLCEVIEDPEAGNDAGHADSGLTVVGFDLSSRHELTWVGFIPSLMRCFCDRPYFSAHTQEVIIGPCQLGINQSGDCSSGLYIEVSLQDGDGIIPVSSCQRYLLIDGVSYLHQLGEMPLPEDVLAALTEYNA